MRPIVTIFFFVICSLGAGAQIVPDSKGRDFWLTFIPNFHNNIDVMETQLSVQLEHQIYIYIGSETPTRGRITLRDSNGVERVIPFQITDPTQLYEYRTLFLPYELRGFNYHNNIMPERMQNERPMKTSVHVEADDDVTVYALNQGWLTSDAFLVLPTDAIGTDYSVMSYTSDVTNDGSEPASSSTPSQFAVVATEDNTTVTITPTAETFRSPNLETQSFVLNKGESYLVQADAWSGTRLDLTGSIVSASRPVAVFGGHQRATIPIEFNSELGSRDCLVEQMNPISTWGKSAFVTEFAVSSNELNIGHNLYRVVAAFDSTEIYVNQALVGMINSGEHFEAPINTAMEIVTTRPAMVAMFKKTAGRGSLGQQRIGDPFMMLVPPAEQFMDRYRFVNIQAYDYEIINNTVIPISDVYVEQYLNVVITSSKTSTVVLDGVPVPQNLFNRIGTSEYSWAQVRMTDGVHDISADTLFGIYVYGYGDANSYGYIGGMAFRPLDNYPPRIMGSTRCGSFDGRVTDSLLSDTRVRSVTPVAGSERNVVFALGTFDPPQAVVSFTMTLVNPFLDGRIVVEAMDNVRQRTQTTINLPGYTIGIKGRAGDPNPEARTKVVPTNRERCDTVTIENYGLFPHTISTLTTTGSAVVSGVTLPITLAAGSSVDVVLCWNVAVRGISSDTLFLGDSCLLRNCVAYTIDAQEDDESPAISGLRDSCATEVSVTVADDRAYDFGLRSVRIMSEIQANCDVVVSTESVPRNTYKVTVIDPLYDAVFGFEAIDSADNASQYIDTVQGFTLALNGDKELFSSNSIPIVLLGSVYCDTVVISNYGITTHTISDVYIRGNVRFSLPQGQFSITVPPGGQVPLVVCYEPNNASEVADMDTLVFFYGCSIRQLELMGLGEEVVFEGISRCELPVQVQVSAIGRLITMPLPASESLTVVLSKETSHLTIRVVDVSGTQVLWREWKGAPTRSFLIDISDVPRGTFAIVVEHDAQTESSLLVVD